MQNQLTKAEGDATLDRIIASCEEIKKQAYDYTLVHSLQRIDNAFTAIVWALRNINEGR